jgi:hypothetical protein
MIALIFFLVVAAALLILLFLLGRRAPMAEGSSQALLDARNALQTLQLDLLALNLVQNIFSQNDLEYVTTHTPTEIQQMFAEERKRIALAWVSEIYRQVVCLQHFHRGYARHFTHLKLTTELALALDFAVLRLQCRALYLLLRLWGPYASSYMAGKTIAAAVRVCAISGKSLAFLTPAGPRPIPEDSARGSVAG